MFHTQPMTSHRLSGRYLYRKERAMTAVQERDTGLRHGAIGMADALASTLSNMAPVEGIFIVLVIVAGAMGTLTPWAFMLGAIGMLMVYVFASAITPVYIW